MNAVHKVNQAKIIDADVVQNIEFHILIGLNNQLNAKL